MSHFSNKDLYVDLKLYVFCGLKLQQKKRFMLATRLIFLSHTVFASVFKQKVLLEHKLVQK